MIEDLEQKRERVREIASEHYKRGDVTGWFEALYAEAAGDNEYIPWADLEPNRFFRQWAESTGLAGNGRTALVVGCGLGDDAKYLHDLGFKVTAFDISPTAIEWAKRLHADTDIRFEVMDLFEPFRGWTYTQAGSLRSGGFDFVLEVYTIQPLPIDMRPQVIDAIAAFVKPGGELVVVTRGREDDAQTDELPWPVSRRDLSRFQRNGLNETNFTIMPPDEEGEPERFVVKYKSGPLDGFLTE
jgi:SAM-dependent methyltransferase